MGNPSSKSSFKNNNLSKQINFIGNNNSLNPKYSQMIQSGGNNPKYSGIKSADRDNEVLTKFTWNYGGNSVYLTGSFNNWKKNIPMDKQGDQFCITLLLPRQVHQYKFIVDGEWRFSPEDSTMSDDNGFINNYIDTTNFQPLIQQGNKNNDMDDLSGPIYSKSKHSNQMANNNKGKIQKKQQYAKYAPKLPPHYQYCLYLGKKICPESANGTNGNTKKSDTQYQQTSHNKNSNKNGQLSSESIGDDYIMNGYYQDENKMIDSTTHNYNSNNNNSQPIQQSSNNNTNTNSSSLPNNTSSNNNNNNNNTNNNNNQLQYQSILTQQQIQYLFKTPHSLPMPSHIVLDHLMIQEDDWYSAMAITQRFKEKYTTFTYYTIDRNIDGEKNMMEFVDHGDVAHHGHLGHRRSL